MRGIFALAGVEDTPTFTRSQIVNQTEITQMVLQSAQYLDEDTIIDLLPFLTPEQKEQVKKANEEDEVESYEEPVVEQPEEQTKEVIENDTEGT